jgi:hypothetical protein
VERSRIVKTNAGVTALLTACARVDGPAETRLSQAVNQINDWTCFLRETEYHNVMPLVNKHLGHLPQAPDDVRVALEQGAREAAEIALAQTSSLVDLAASFAVANIVAVPFKGPSLAIAAYGDVGLRAAIDLDFVVQARDALRAHRTLYELGFRGGPESAAMLRAWVRYGRSVTLARGNLIVDLQWASDLADRHLELPFSRLRSIAIGANSLPMFADEDLLLLLCIHGSKHLWSHLYWVVDVAELINMRPGLRWGRLLEEARQVGSHRRLLVGVALAERLRPSILPRIVHDQLSADPEAVRLAEVLWNRMFDEHVARFPLSRLHLHMRERPVDRVAFVWRLGITPTDEDWDWLELPGHLWWLYPLLRPLRLGSKYGRRLVRRFLEWRPAELV